MKIKLFELRQIIKEEYQKIVIESKIDDIARDIYINVSEWSDLDFDQLNDLKDKPPVAIRKILEKIIAT